MLTELLGKIFGTKTTRDLKEINPVVKKILAVEPAIQALSNDGLRAKTLEFKQQIADDTKDQTARITEIREQIEATDDVELKETLFDEIERIETESLEIIEKTLLNILPEAFSVIKETARRFTENQELEVNATSFDMLLASEKEHVKIKGDKAVWNSTWMVAGNPTKWEMIHYDVQLIGGVALHQGKIAEMQTGEGKTLVATLPVYLNALTGRGVHLVTVNDYLAKRDSEWMGPLYEFHGLSVDCIDRHQPHSPGRIKAYNSDITFGTNNEFGFDYLRDNMSRSPEELVQRKHHFAIVDEVDSVLIDDARTPLIISGPTPKGDLHEFNELKPHVAKLVNAQKQLVQQALNDAKKLISEGDTTEGGKQLLRAHRGLPKSKPLIKFLSQDGIRTILQKTENFYMQEQSKNMHIIDDELYFVIDEKNNQIDLTDKGIDLIAGDTERDFFLMPDITMALSELEKEELSKEDKIRRKDEILHNFTVKSERIHSMNQLIKAYALFEKDVEYVVMENKVKIVDEQTGRIMEGRRYSDGLHQALEAKENVKIEAATQTYATVTLQNYFRMYHKLAGMTGTAETEAGEFWDIYKLDVMAIPTNRPIARDDKDDLVYKTRREKFNAVIEEIETLTAAGRPVLVGTTSVEISELLSRSLKLRKIKHNVLNAKLHQKEAEIVAEAGKPGNVTIATNMAGRGTDIKLTPESKAAGGLAIVGTERHDSRRVDRQLRGRAGRQGDPGSSQFFVSLEDDLMRLFGSERIAKIMDRLGHKEGEVIQHSMVSKSIERAQRKVEENNFGMRKHLLEYDDVMNAQREVIYKRRRAALYGERLAVDIMNAIYDTAESIVNQNIDARDFDNFELELAAVFSIESPVDEETFKKISAQDLTTALYEKAFAYYREKNKRITDIAFPVIRDVYEKQKATFKTIAVPITDGRKAMQVVTNLEQAVKTEGRQLILDFEKALTLALIDESWKNHLRDMDDLRQSVRGAVYEQKDPSPARFRIGETPPGRPPHPG
ncbi:MAG: preprotein translocase subunit SecA, partial [Flavobacteriales bacterium]